MDPIIKIENLSKQYRLGNVGTGTLSHDLNRWWARVQGKEDPFLKIGETNNQNTKGESDYVWALKDINLEVMPGEVLGIIGKNGAGKSTLLKLLSRVTAPTTGSIKTRGRIASLLEVGTGFHPELTGRENIFLNGAILGMTKAEIRSKFDEIVDFAGVERYIDTPVKRYSSGMYVRLAFAVAAHLEPEILVVDEVLAVGDAEFQKKALGKMQDVSLKDGRTVLFVSHNMGAIKNLCNKTMLLHQGNIIGLGNTQEIVNDYYSQNIKYSSTFFDYRLHNRQFPMGQKVRINSLSFNNRSPIYHNKRFEITFNFTVNEKSDDLCFGIGINSIDGTRIVTVDSDANCYVENTLNFEQGNYEVLMQLDEFFLEPGLYNFDLAIRVGRGTLNVLDYFSNQSYLEILPNDNTPNHVYENKTGSYRPIPSISKCQI
ncbi:MAG: ABC transporter ATP-binding protein [Bacteroidetes bacterium]|nr:ABC transporter ATP-binding protein [Bacteroidota bacterium]